MSITARSHILPWPPFNKLLSTRSIQRTIYYIIFIGPYYILENRSSIFRHLLFVCLFSILALAGSITESNGTPQPYVSVSIVWCSYQRWYRCCWLSADDFIIVRPVRIQQHHCRLDGLDADTDISSSTDSYLRMCAFHTASIELKMDFRASYIRLVHIRELFCWWLIYSHVRVCILCCSLVFHIHSTWPHTFVRSLRWQFLSFFFFFRKKEEDNNKNNTCIYRKKKINTTHISTATTVVSAWIGLVFFAYWHCSKLKC